MEEIEYEVGIYSYTIVFVLGILGNILVILSILRQRSNVLKNNYYFLVLNLAICDLAVLILYTYQLFEFFWPDELLSVHFRTITCYVFVTNLTFQFAGVGMMLTISLIRYRAAVHSLKPAISRRKLTVICGLVYIVGLSAACGTRLPVCFIKSKVVLEAYWKFYYALAIFFGMFVPTVFMAVVYSKIAQTLIKHNKYMKRVCSNAMRRPERVSFNIFTYIRNRRTFLVCLSTVLCYGIGHAPLSVWFIWFITAESHPQIKYGWVGYLIGVLKIAGSHSVNPLIYGILDKKLIAFSKFCRKKKRRTQQN